VKTDIFDYDLPQDRIAQTPIEPRHDSRLLVYDRATDQIQEGIFKNIQTWLQPGDLLVLNKTKVLPARIFGKKETGGTIEVLLLKKITTDKWEAMVGGRNLTIGKVIYFDDGLSAKIIDDLGRSERLVQFSKPVETFMRKQGQMPLPPYIHTKLEDQNRYQTVFAEEEGSAAAPTAGLHFTHSLIDQLRKFGIEFAEITLHVGLDTFAPVTEDDIEAHAIHTEWCQMDASAAGRINQTKREGNRVIAVGTTSVRTLETADRFRDDQGQLRAFKCPTDLFITPGYSYRVVDCMITNFHLPRSTLLMLVSAFSGLDSIKRCYQYAMDAGFRFYSFGDAMLIL
jgi:S-adenosylmethionine:tRNA ribosyltransferase-isomerase